MQSFKNWLERPFSPDMSAFQWFLFFGFIIVLATSWKLILSNFEGVD